MNLRSARFQAVAVLPVLMAFSLSTRAADEPSRPDPEWERVQLESTVNERAKSVIGAFTSGQQWELRRWRVVPL